MLTPDQYGTTLLPINFETDDQIAALDMEVAPFASMLLAAEAAGFLPMRRVAHFNFGVANRKLRTMSDTTSAAEDSATVWNVSNPTRYKMGYVIKKLAATYVVTNISGSKITVLLRTGSHTTISAGAEDIFILGRAETFGYDVGPSHDLIPSSVTQNMQKISHPIAISEDVMGSALAYTSSALQDERADKFLEFLRDYDRSALVGVKNDGDGTEAGRTMDGLNTVVSTYADSIAAGSFTLAAWNNFCATKAFAKGSKVKVGFASPAFWARVYSLYSDKERWFADAEVLGSKITRFRTQAGTIIAVDHQEMPEMGLDETLVVVDPRRIRSAKQVNEATNTDLGLRLQPVKGGDSTHKTLEEWSGTVSVDYGDEAWHSTLDIT